MGQTGLGGYGLKVSAECVSVGRGRAALFCYSILQVSRPAARLPASCCTVRAVLKRKDKAGVAVCMKGGSLGGAVSRCVADACSYVFPEEGRPCTTTTNHATPHHIPSPTTPPTRARTARPARETGAKWDSSTPRSAVLLYAGVADMLPPDQVSASSSYTHEGLMRVLRPCGGQARCSPA